MTERLAAVVAPSGIVRRGAAAADGFRRGADDGAAWQRSGVGRRERKKKTRAAAGKEMGCGDLPRASRAGAVGGDAVPRGTR